MSHAPENLTEMLKQWGGGDRDALDRIMPIIYDELRRIAKRRFRRERPDNTLQATALVNEVYIRLVDQKGVSWQSRAHFFAIAARIMRQIRRLQAGFDRHKRRA
jgi:RNA polymerase sigma factor (TIGR02999 family)